MKNKLVIIGAIIIALVGTALFWKYQLKDRLIGPKDSTETETQLPAIHGVLTSKQIATTRPVAVVIENHTNARPQSGLTKADIVYETLAEGGITRFLALFQTQNVEEIGPIRSARPYFNHIANQWGAVYAHVGGSTLALNELNADVHKKLTDLNQYFFGDYFYRSKERAAPHNAYTSMDLLHTLIEKKDWKDWTPVKLGEFETIPTGELQTTTNKISAKFFDDNYTANFTFDPSTGLYARSNGTKSAIDKNNQQPVYMRNVLIQYVDDYIVPMEPANGLGLRLEEDGRAILFTGGKMTNGTWRYKNGFTEYITTNGAGETQAMKFQPGQTWIVLMPKSLAANVSWE